MRASHGLCLAPARPAMALSPVHATPLPLPTASLPLFGTGGLDRLMSRVGLGGHSRDQVRRRIVFWVAIAWLPLLVFSRVQSWVPTPGLRLAFVEDFSLHVRFLVVLPILVAAEQMVQTRI